MRVLFAVLAAVALAQKKEKVKVPTVCFGKEDEDHMACKKMMSGEDCGKDDKCTWGKDRFEQKSMNLAKCMAKEKVDIGATCEKPGEVDTCKCGTVCHHIEWMQKNVCSTCADFGMEEDCDVGPEALSCKWMDIDEGKCVLGKNDCSELSKKECGDAKEMCMYMKKGKYCMKNYKSQCYGIKADLHGKCHNVKTKRACMEVRTMFDKPLCKWGQNKHELEGKMEKCLNDVGEMGKTCSSQADCQCGSSCLVLDYGGGFILKACSLCKDMGAEADCDTAAAAGMGCKWVGGEDGVCLKKDMCRELTFEEDKCKDNSMCMWKEDACMMAPITKKTCKTIGKRKKGEPKSDEAVAEAKIMCSKIPECMWTEKGKCANRKQK